MCSPVLLFRGAQFVLQTWSMLLSPSRLGFGVTRLGIDGSGLTVQLCVRDNMLDCSHHSLSTVLLMHHIREQARVTCVESEEEAKEQAKADVEELVERNQMESCMRSKHVELKELLRDKECLQRFRCRASHSKSPRKCKQSPITRHQTLRGSVANDALVLYCDGARARALKQARRVKMPMHTRAHERRVRGVFNLVPCGCGRTSKFAGYRM